MIKEIIKLYNRDLDRLKNEIEAFQDESNLWKITGNITNTAGNLSLHLCGNLNAFIGKNLGDTDYVRNREFEFSGKNVSKKDLIEQITSTKSIIEKSLSTLDDTALADSYPENIFGFEMTTGYCLVHLIAHFSYHLGQINYLRRILE